jgi:hypothetical protein
MEIKFSWRGCYLFIGRLSVGYVAHVDPPFPHLPLPWCGVIPFGSIAGTPVGYFATEGEARDAVINAAIEAMSGEPDAKP